MEKEKISLFFQLSLRRSRLLLLLFAVYGAAVACSLSIVENFSRLRGFSSVSSEDFCPIRAQG